MQQSVLIVDDQRGIRFLLEEIISSEGYQVKSCESGLEAMEEIKKERPDLLIIDYYLPRKSGAEIIKEIEANNYNIPVIVMSGVIEEVKELTQNFQSVKAYFSKPFNIMEVKEQVKQILPA